jgi:hypothetical protein
MIRNPPSPPLSSTGKLGPVSTDRTVASLSQPVATTGGGDSRTTANVYLTQVQGTGQPTPILYNGDRLWAKVTMTLTTAGPVAVGPSSSLLPVLSGKGIPLITNQPLEMIIAKGSRIYCVSTAVNRVNVKIEPLPWLEQITGLISQVVSGIMSRFK